MDNSQDFYKMDKICISIYPDFAALILSFSSLDHEMGFADIAVAAPPQHSPEELHHPALPHCSWPRGRVQAFLYEACVFS